MEAEPNLRVQRANLLPGPEAGGGRREGPIRKLKHQIKSGDRGSLAAWWEKRAATKTFPTQVRITLCKTEFSLPLRDNLLIIFFIYPLKLLKESSRIQSSAPHLRQLRFHRIGRRRICAAAFDASITGRWEALACLGFRRD